MQLFSLHLCAFAENKEIFPLRRKGAKKTKRFYAKVLEYLCEARNLSIG
jgi:hypothetical protein